MGQADELLKQGLPQGSQLNYDMTQYNNNYNNMLNSYQQQTSNALNNYKQLGQQNINSIKQQTQQQIAFLNQQLEANKQKYQLEGQQQEALINKQYKEANTQIDQQAFNNYKYANQMGANRGVSNSAQQMAMDNSVGQQTASLFNQNLSSKNDNINTLKQKIQSQMLDLDLQHASSLNDLSINQMQKQMEIMNQMSEKEFDYLSQQADKILQIQMSNNELQFNTQKEMEQYRASLVTKLYEMQFSNAQKEDDRTFQSTEAQKDRDFQASQNALDRALQSALSASRGSGSSKSDSDSTKSFTQEEIMYQEQLAYYVNAEGLDYITAMQKAQADVQKYLDSQGSVFTQNQKKTPASFEDLLKDAMKNRASSILKASQAKGTSKSNSGIGIIGLSNLPLAGTDNWRKNNKA